jgi:hypothetical protein
MAFIYNPATALATYGYVPFTVLKSTPDGDTLWTASHGAAVTGMTIDASGNVYTVGDAVNAAGLVWSAGARTGYYTTRKYSPTGELLWSADHGQSLSYITNSYNMAIHLGADGYLYTGGSGNSTTGNLTRYDPDTGEVLAQLITGGAVYIQGIVADASGNLFLIGTGNYALAKYSGSGTLLESTPVTLAPNGDYRWPRRLVADPDGNLVVQTDAPIFNYLTRFLFRYDTGCGLLTEQAEYDSRVPWRGMAIDADNRVYLVAKSYGTPAYHAPSLSRFNADFDLEWQNTTALDGKGDARSVAVAEVEMPALRMPLALAVPTINGDRYIAIPPLALPIALAAPLFIRDYVGPAAPTIYRLVLTGDDGPLPLPMATLQIRRNASGAFVEASIPAVDMTLLEQISDRMTGSLVVYRGVILPDGSELSDVLMEMPLTNLRYDGGISSASVALRGNGPPEAEAVDYQRTRVLRGVSYRNTTDGQRRVRCEVDTWLRAGDTADLGGGETLIVSDITITLSDRQATMEVAGV